jgi:predicted O-methyltransferase YrrM
VPLYDTDKFHQEWQGALEVFTQLDEMEIPCAMGIGTRRILFQAVRAMGATDILDIGTFTGTSALTFALAVGDSGRVTTVDIRDANSGDAHWRSSGRARSPMDLMAMAGVKDRVEFVMQDSVEYLRSTKKKFDFISLDGWHEDFAVYSEIELAMTRLKPNGIIFLDDVQTPGYAPPPGFDVIPGPWQAIERRLLEGAPLIVTFLNRTLEGEPIACAFLTRAP